MINRKHQEFFEKVGFNPRQAQKDALEFFQKNPNKKYYIVDAPTGSGKTHIALARAFDGKRVYILTSTKQLQDQYLNAFEDVVLIKGKNNYPCHFNSEMNCENGFCFSYPIIKKTCKERGLCPYYTQLDKALRSSIVITNYDYFIFGTFCGTFSEQAYENNPSKYENVIKRDDLICDEAHNLEDKLINFAEFTINLKEIELTYNVKFENFQFNKNENIENIEKKLNTIASVLKSKLAEYKEIIDNINKRYESQIFSQLFEESKLDKFKQIEIDLKDKSTLNAINKLYYKLDKIVSKLNVYVNNSPNNEWVYKVESEEEVFCSPLNASGLFSEYFGKIARQYVFMSATMGESTEFIKEMGLSNNLTESIYVESEFNPSLSPVIHVPVGKMNYTEIDKTLPNIAMAVQRIINDNHPNDKGIIHTSNYKIADYIYNNVKDGRILHRDIYKGNRLNNYELVQKHNETDFPTVLLSPSMIEGVSLDDDLSRFQIIVKLPFKSLGNFRTATKMKMNSDWYTYKMWVNLMQASGRSTRSKDDYSVTYVLDSSFQYFLRISRNKLSKWFVDRIKM